MGISGISGKYYYFYSSGKLAKSTWVGKYYVDATGARTDRQKQTGWVTVDGKKYYFDKEGNMIRSRWLYFNSGNDRYYVGADGAMVTGIQTIGGKNIISTRKEPLHAAPRSTSVPNDTRSMRAASLSQRKH